MYPWTQVMFVEVKVLLSRFQRELAIVDEIIVGSRKTAGTGGRCSKLVLQERKPVFDGRVPEIVAGAAIGKQDRRIILTARQKK